jgi:hypothetical protein
LKTLKLVREAKMQPSRPVPVATRAVDDVSVESPAVVWLDDDKDMLKEDVKDGKIQK